MMCCFNFNYLSIFFKCLVSRNLFCIFAVLRLPRTSMI
nr:MAG TPA: hypothetical protein [Crassvirales sp.]DAU16044.1 MAG TPA: hypothetical protein [Caudoviricetes sp.]